MDDETPGVGSVLVERYRLDELYRQGTVSRVFVARDLLLDRDVAVKVIDGLGDDVTAGRALRAARAAARADDPHVIRVLDVHPGRPPFLVLELHRAAPLDISDAAPRFAIADDLLTALAALHAVGAVHRDVRAENVLPTAQGRTFLTAAGMMEAARDPGLGRSPGPVEVEPKRVHSAPSPEQERGLPADARSDVFAAGMLLEDLIGHNAGPAVVAVLGKATAEEPAARFPDASAMRQALLEARDADSTAPIPPAPAPRAGGADTKRMPLVRGGRRFTVPVVAGAVVAMLAGLSAAAVLGLGRGGTSSASAPPPPTPRATAATTPSSPASERDLVPAAGPQTALDELLTRPDLVGGTDAEADLIARLRRLNDTEGAERSAGAAELIGLTAILADEGAISRDLARAVFDALAGEVTLDGLVAFAEDDPAAIGPDGPAFLDRLRTLDELRGEERARTAAELYGWASDGGSGDERPLTPQFAAAALAVLLPELTLEGLIALAEADPAAAGPAAPAFAEQLRALVLQQGEQREASAGELYGRASAGGLSGRYAAAATAALIPELTPDGLIALAGDATLAGPDGPGYVERLRELGSLEGERRSTAAMDLLADVDASAAAQRVTGPFVIAAVQVLRPLTLPPPSKGS